MFGATTQKFQLGKYTAASRPVDPTEDWTANFKKIAETMWDTETINTGLKNTVTTLMGETESQHTLVDGINTRVATTATKFNKINLDLSETRITVNQAGNTSSGALTLATSANQTAQQAQQTANEALSRASQNTTSLADLRQRILKLESEEKENVVH